MTQQPVPSAPVTDVGGEVETLLASHLKSLTLEQKVRLLTGADFWSLHPEPDIGLRTGSRTLGRDRHGWPRRTGHSGSRLVAAVVISR